MKIIATLALLALLPAFLNSCATVAGSQQKTSQVVLASVRPYPLDTCMVIGAKLSSTPETYTRVYNGQEVKFCCTSCVTAFEANPEPFLARLKKDKGAR